VTPRRSHAGLARHLTANPEPDDGNEETRPADKEPAGLLAEATLQSGVQLAGDAVDLAIQLRVKLSQAPFERGLELAEPDLPLGIQFGQPPLELRLEFREPLLQLGVEPRSSARSAHGDRLDMLRPPD
jgi:hypothetical protein